MDEAVEHYLDLCRRGEVDEAFFGLVDLVDDPTAELKSVFRNDLDPTVRWFIVRVVGERRRSDSIDLMEEAIRDADPDVWKEAIDGLVNLGSVESMKILERRLRELGSRDQKLKEWISEAINQMNVKLASPSGE